MIPIAFDQFVRDYLEANPDGSESEIRAALTEAVEAKRSGTPCWKCGQPIWAAGSAVTGQYGCYTCITLEADDSEDFEIDSVCL